MATSVRLFREMNMNAPSCQLAARASIQYIYNDQAEAVCAELYDIALQNSRMNLPINKFTRVANTKLLGKWFSTQLKTVAVTVSHVSVKFTYCTC